MPPDPQKRPPVPDTSDINKAALPWECFQQCTAISGASGPNDPNTGPGSPINPPGPPKGPPPNGAPVNNPPDEVSGNGPGIEPHESSFLRKLARMLQLGERSELMSGFTEEKPEWLQNFERVSDRYDEASPEQAERLYTEIEEDLERKDRPDFYLYTDLREEDIQ